MDKRITIVTRMGFVLAGLFALACTESVEPKRDEPSTPLFSFSPSGVTLHTDNGALGYSGQLIRKGFDRRDANGQIINPRAGDAVVATFYWFGSTNIIESVSDVYTDAFLTPIGNTYNLVDYVQTGGISMATYAATNVHFDSTRGYVFAVQATFREPFSDGGIKMTAWTGVEDVYANAVGGFHSASVAASTPTPVAPGPITIGAGSVAYGVSLSNGGVNIASRPAGFTNIGGGIGSDGQMQDDGDYYISSGGETVNPQWTWDFQRPSTALATVLELRPGGAPPPPSGNLTASASTSGASLDPDGYTVAVDGGTGQALGINGSVTFSNLSAGSHAVALTGVAANCTVSGANPQTVNVPGGGTATAAFAVSCAATTGSLTATSSTSGSNLDPDGYTVAVDGGASQAIAVNGSVSFSGLNAGNHSVALSGVAANCTVTSANPQTVNVPVGGSAAAAFTVDCVIPPGNLAVTTSTTGSSLDPDGYTVAVDGGAGRAIASNGSTTFTSLSAGNHTVQLSGVAANCTLSGTNPRTISVPSGGTAPITFAVNCNSPPVVNAGPNQTAVTGLLYSLQWSFTDADHNGPFSYTINWGDGSTSSGNVSSEGSFSAGHTYVIVLPRSFTVKVTVRDARGASASASKTVSVLLL